LKRAKSIDKKINILKNSYMLFINNGFNNTGIRDIAKASNIERGLLHYYFPKKEDILFCLYTDLLDNFHDFIMSTIKHDYDALTLFITFDALYFKYVFQTRLRIEKYNELLQNTLIVNLKIRKTFEWLETIYNKRNAVYDRDWMLVCLTVLIGSEAALLELKLNNDITLDYQDLIILLLKNYCYMQGVDRKKTDRIVNTALRVTAQIDLERFDDYFRKHSSWYSDLPQNVS